jgi:hypothetical protein
MSPGRNSEKANGFERLAKRRVTEVLHKTRLIANPWGSVCALISISDSPCPAPRTSPYVIVKSEKGAALTPRGRPQWKNAGQLFIVTGRGTAWFWIPIIFTSAPLDHSSSLTTA